MQSRNIFLLLLLVIKISLTSTSEHQHQHVVCNTIEVRSYKELTKLENCTIVLGNVAIMIGYEGTAEDLTEEDVKYRSFPLREVTGFVFLHTIIFLDTLSSIFPNLTIIRGQRLFSNYALVLYDTQLTELGLTNLVRINRGSVRIAGVNPNLCLPKIDWSKIIQMGPFITTGKNVTSLNCTAPKCSGCPKNFCWNENSCQKFLSKESVRVKNETLPCHKLCIGGCVNGTARGCLVCNDLSEDFKCVESCSVGRLLNIDTRRCVKPEECIKANRKIHEKECLQACPSGYSEESSVNGTCKPCHDKCPKVCTYPHEIKTIGQLEAVGTGCTIINSSLEINIIDDISNLTAELQTYLGNIEEIHGNLRIHRSNAITTLTFLNNLRLVASLSTPTAIRIFENQNLQNIFDWRLRGDKKLTIKYGSVLIYNNFRLCENEVANFKKLIEGNETRKEDYMLNNGNNKKCKNTEIKTDYTVLSYDAVEIVWIDNSITNISNIDDFPGYLIQYVPIDEFEQREVDENMLYERDICSSFGWKNALVKQKDVRIENNSYRYTLRNLTQYTSYAYTVQLYYYETADAFNDHNSPSNRGGATEAQIFRTKMIRPSRVTKFGTALKTTESIMLEFDVTSNEKSAIDKFLLFVFEVEDYFNAKEIDQRDYCQDPIERQDTVIYSTASEKNRYDDRENCCEKCCDEKRKAREANDDYFKEELIKFSDKVRNDQKGHFEKMKNLKEFKELFYINGTLRSHTITKLKPFTFYKFHIYACSIDSTCSEYELHSDRTAHNEKYDRVVLRPVPSELVNKFVAYFEEPKLKNGAIVNYIVEIRGYKENVSQLLLTECITRKMHEKNLNRYTLNNLNEGNYSIRVMAVSLAGNGQFSDLHYFSIVIPQKEFSWNWIIIGLSLLIIFVVSGSISYYYKHKIITILKRQGDSVILMNDVQPTDFHNVSLKHTSCDRLSDILEYDEY